MDICLRPDDSLPDNRMHVSCDLDRELLELLGHCDFDIVVDETEASNCIRLSPALAERIETWTTLAGLSQWNNHRDQ